MYFLSHLIVLVVSIVCKYSQVKFPRCICFLVTTLSLLSSLMLILFLHRNTYQYRFWNHQMQQRQQEEKALTISSVSFLRFHSVSIMMSFSFQLWCTRASSATCRQSFKDCTQELLGKLLKKVISKWITVFNYGILLQEFIFISNFSTHRSFSPRTKLFSPTINPEMRLLQVSLRNAASERIQQILSGKQNQKRYCHCDKTNKA